MKNSNNTIGSRIHGLLGCSSVPQSTAPPHAPLITPIEPLQFAGLQVFAAVRLKTPYYRDKTPRHWVIDYRCSEGTWCLRNVGNRFPSDNALYPRRIEFSFKMRQRTNGIFSNSKITHDSEKYLHLISAQ
jgi:hypothetical protein